MKYLYNLFKSKGRKKLLSPFDIDDYRKWIESHELVRSNVLTNYSIKISIIIPTYNSNLKFLRRAIESCIYQTYRNFELILVDDCSQDQNVIHLINEYIIEYKNISLHKNKKRKNISETLNTGIYEANGDWVCFLDHDDLLSKNALESLVVSIIKNEGIKVIYSDEDKIDCNDNRYEPNFKTEFNQGLLLSQNYICHLLCVKYDILKETLFRFGYEGAQDWDLCLRLSQLVKRSEFFHIPEILYHWRAHERSTAKDISVKSESVEKSVRKTLTSFLKVNSLKANIIKTKGNHWHLDYMFNEKIECTDIIFYGKKPIDVQKYISEFIDSTDYKNFRIYLPAKWISKGIKYKTWEIHNNMFFSLKGKNILFIESSIKPKLHDWLSNLVAGVQNDNVAFVGPRLIDFKSGRNFSSGMSYTNGSVENLYKDYDIDFPGMHYRIHVNSSHTFLHPSCLLIRRELLKRLEHLNHNILFRLLLYFSLSGKYNNYIPKSECYCVNTKSKYLINDECTDDSLFSKNLRNTNGKIFLK